MKPASFRNTIFSILLGTLTPNLLHADSPLLGRIIAIDPGHGTLDFQGHIINSGKSTSNSRFSEHYITYQIAQKLGKLIENAGGQVVYTRNAQDYWRFGSSTTEDNKSRALLANVLKADAYISIHCDWNPKRKMRGVTTYYKTEQSRKLAENVQKKLVGNLKAFNRKTKKDSYTVLDVATMPAILVESGFLSNPSEAKKLITANYQKKVAEAIHQGLSNTFANEVGYH
ncbi:MAG: N-acetylmuramoyl-L-alanine amidase LytC [Elusimicrobia bacterium]|nr:N-acetylmuramoyl-L-alanine amidase LytC [Elusimicrobiota bacterium]